MGDDVGSEVVVRGKVSTTSHYRHTLHFAHPCLTATFSFQHLSGFVDDDLHSVGHISPVAIVIDVDTIRNGQVSGSNA